MTKTTVRKYLATITDEKVVDINLYADNKMAIAITISEFHSVWEYNLKEDENGNIKEWKGVSLMTAND